MTQKLFTKNFTLLICGQAVSLFGNHILRLALSLYVLDVTGSAAVFAGILSAATVPSILLSPFGGILADRADKRKAMAALDALSGISVLCAAAFLSGGSAVTAVGALLVALSILGAFETPTVQACIPAMLPASLLTKGNAAVNQAASLSYFAAPALGGVLYARFGLLPVMYAGAACFFATAAFECFLELGDAPPAPVGGFLSTIRQDFLASMRFLASGQGGILKMLLYVAVSRFFVMGVTIVGLPYLVRTVLGLGAEYYGAAESALAVAAILGGAAAGLLAGRLGTGALASLLAALGLCMFPAGAAFALHAGTKAAYLATVLSFCGVQLAAGIFSIFAISLIQQNTPGHLIGKTMAYASAVPLCAQPIGQVAYGFLFDRLHGAASLVLIPTGIAVCAIGLSSAGFFRSLENGQAGAPPRRG